MAEPTGFFDLGTLIPFLPGRGQSGSQTQPNDYPQLGRLGYVLTMRPDIMDAIRARGEATAAPPSVDLPPLPPSPLEQIAPALPIPGPAELPAALAQPSLDGPSLAGSSPWAVVGPIAGFSRPRLRRRKARRLARDVRTMRAQTDQRVLRPGEAPPRPFYPPVPVETPRGGTSQRERNVAPRARGRMRMPPVGVGVGVDAGGIFEAIGSAFGGLFGPEELGSGEVGAEEIKRREEEAQNEYNRMLEGLQVPTGVALPRRGGESSVDRAQREAMDPRYEPEIRRLPRGPGPVISQTVNVPAGRQPSRLGRYVRRVLQGARSSPIATSLGAAFALMDLGRSRSAPRSQFVTPTATPAPAVPPGIDPAPLGFVGAQPYMFPVTGSGGGTIRPTSSRTSSCSCGPRGPRRRCLERAPVVYRSGRRKGKAAGTKCVRFANP